MHFIDPTKPITMNRLQEIANKRFGDMVKAVVDIDKRIVVLDAEIHSDQEKELIKKGSKQNDLWGINLYPEVDDDDFIEFNSMINLRPRQGNNTRSVDDETIQKKIISIIHLCIQ